MEMKKRVKIEMMKRHKLKNPNIIVSTTRICIHNIPRSVDDKKLKVFLSRVVLLLFVLCVSLTIESFPFAIEVRYPTWYQIK